MKISDEINFDFRGVQSEANNFPTKTGEKEYFSTKNKNVIPCGYFGSKTNEANEFQETGSNQKVQQMYQALPPIKDKDTSIVLENPNHVPQSDKDDSSSLSSNDTDPQKTSNQTSSPIAAEVSREDSVENRTDPVDSSKKSISSEKTSILGEHIRNYTESKDENNQVVANSPIKSTPNLKRFESIRKSSEFYTVENIRQYTSAIMTPTKSRNETTKNNKCATPHPKNTVQVDKSENIISIDKQMKELRVNKLERRKSAITESCTKVSRDNNKLDSNDEVEILDTSITARTRRRSVHAAREKTTTSLNNEAVSRDENKKNTLVSLEKLPCTPSRKSVHAAREKTNVSLNNEAVSRNENATDNLVSLEKRPCTPSRKSPSISNSGSASNKSTIGIADSKDSDMITSTVVDNEDIESNTMPRLEKQNDVPSSVQKSSTKNKTKLLSGTKITKVDPESPTPSKEALPILTAVEPTKTAHNSNSTGNFESIHKKSEVREKLKLVVDKKTLFRKNPSEICKMSLLKLKKEKLMVPAMKCTKPTYRSVTTQTLISIINETSSMLNNNVDITIHTETDVSSTKQKREEKLDKKPTPLNTEKSPEKPKAVPIAVVDQKPKSELVVSKKLSRRKKLNWSSRKHNRRSERHSTSKQSDKNDDVIITLDKRQCRICKEPLIYEGTVSDQLTVPVDKSEDVCSACSICFLQKPNLKSDPLQCQICHQRFMRACNLESHMMRHTGERPFVCSICFKTFGHKSHLTRHSRTIHNRY